MKNNIFKLCFVIAICFFVIGCTNTVSTDEKGNSTREFSVGQTATVNNTNITINSVKKILRECIWEYDGNCESYSEPDNDYFLLIDLTIKNNGDEDLSISSLMSFSIKNTKGESGNYELLSNSIQTQLDGTVMSNDLLKGQIAYDVIDDEKFYFYFLDSLIDSPIKFVINKSDIIE